MIRVDKRNSRSFMVLLWMKEQQKKSAPLFPKIYMPEAGATVPVYPVQDCSRCLNIGCLLAFGVLRYFKGYFFTLF